MLQLRKTKGKLPRDIEFSFYEEQMMKQLSEATRMTLPFCADCLTQANWNYQTALEIFQQKKDSLNPTAFLQ